MYLMGRDEYECDICGFREKWDAHDDHRGYMWECERFQESLRRRGFQKDAVRNGQCALPRVLAEPVAEERVQYQHP